MGATSALDFKAPVGRLPDRLRKPRDAPRPDDDVHEGSARANLLMRHLRNASCHYDDGLRPSLLQLPNVSELREDLMLRLLAHRARIEHDHARLLNGLRSREAKALKHAGDGLRVALIHLAAHGINEVRVSHDAMIIAYGSDRNGSDRNGSHRNGSDRNGSDSHHPTV